MLHQGKVAVVTGSSRGIGKAIALRLAREGAEIVVCARSEQSTNELPGSVGETAAAIRAMGRKALPIPTDVANDRDVQLLTEIVANEFGRVDILVNNAALAGLAGPGKPFLESSAALLDNFYRVNVRAPFVLCRTIGSLMAKNGGGVIVNISSRMGHLPASLSRKAPSNKIPQVNMGYGISKAALDRFSAAIAAELFRYNIAVITLYPPLTMLERLVHRADLDLSRAESPEVTARAVSVLCQNPMAHTGKFLTSREALILND